VVSRKRSTGAAERSAREAGKAAAAAATPQGTADGRKPQPGVLVSLRMDPVDKGMLQAAYAQAGVKLGGGIKLSALYVLQEIQAGRLVLTKAGLFPGKGV